jgi:hypothetical protein
MTLAVALLLWARIAAGGAVPPLRLEDACRTVQAHVAAEHSGWRASIGDSVTWAVSPATWDVWISGERRCLLRYVLSREGPDGFEVLSHPTADADSVGEIGVWVRGPMAWGPVEGFATMPIEPARVAGHPRRRVLVRELQPWLPPEGE